MKRFQTLISKTTLVVVALVVAGVANASTYTAANNGSDICCFGSPDTTNFGETFSVSNQSKVQDWTYYATSGTAGDVQLVIASWDGTKAVGPALYTSSVFSYGGSTQGLSFGGIDTILGSGSYIAYITTAGVANPASNVYMVGSNENGGLGGEFMYLNSNGTDPLTLSSSWSGYSVPDMAFTANISAVPLPPAIAMMIPGLGLLGFMVRHRKGKTADIA
jgi:hypothetical protein